MHYKFVICAITVAIITYIIYKYIPNEVANPIPNLKNHKINGTDNDSLNMFANMIAVVAFAITGVFAIYTPTIDLFGAIVLGVITAIGGGTIRDVIMDVPMVWIKTPIYVWLPAIASIITFYTASMLSQSQLYEFILYIDGLGSAMFGIQGARKAWNHTPHNCTFAIIMGVISAIGGGLIRDILSGNKTLLMSHDLYAVPVLFGCALYVFLLKYSSNLINDNAITIVSTTFIFLFRAASIKWHLTVPKIFIGKS
jgi:uncharacterized membrane protein YeiH